MEKKAFTKISIKNEKDVTSNEIRVMKLDGGSQPVVQQFEFGKLHRAGEGSYANTKAKFGPLAATDPDRVAKSQKDRRFSINPLLRDPLSIEDEERRTIEEKVRARVGAIADEARAKAAEEGFKTGQEKGHAEAFARFQQEGGERMKQFEGLIGEAESAKQEIFRANERFLMEMIFRLGKMVTLKELSIDKEYLLRLSRELIERMGARENIRIRIHPGDSETLAMIKPGLEAALGTMKNLNVEVSPQVKRGGCMVETEWNAIDASLDTQFQGIYESLVGKTTDEEQEPHGAT